MKAIYTPRRCPICRLKFDPKRAAQRACGFACSRKLAGYTWGMKQPAPFAAELRKRKLARKIAIEQACQRQWPELSVREIEIFNYAVKLGYQRGYQKALAHKKRTRQVAA